MAKLTSEKLNYIEIRLSDLQQQVSKLVEERNTEIQKLFCETEGLIPGESLITADGKVYLYQSLEKGNTTGVWHDRNGLRHTPSVFGYQILNSGKVGTSLRRIYLTWSKVS